jgi:hypothetical protein
MLQRELSYPASFRLVPSPDAREIGNKKPGPFSGAGRMSVDRISPINGIAAGAQEKLR